MTDWVLSISSRNARLSVAWSNVSKFIRTKFWWCSGLIRIPGSTPARRRLAQAPERKVCKIVRGVLSPLLANVLLDEVDRELERRGHCFVRYADDANVYVRSRRAGQRVMALLTRLYEKLHLSVNESKSAVASVFGRKFLGYAFWASPQGVKRTVAVKARQRFKQCIRWFTRRSGGRSLQQVVDRLRSYMLGWKGYFGLSQTPRIWRELDEWIRHRLRAIQLKQWRRSLTIYRELRRLGASEATARKVAGSSRCWWRNSALELNRVLDIAWFDRMGLPRLS